jgi:release factor glutamine methyltransferase
MEDLVGRLRGAGCVFAEEEAELLTEAATSPAGLEELVSRRVTGEPLEYVVGYANFLGIKVSLDPGVFIPRRRTEFLARAAIRRCAPKSVVLDLCCGAGAIGAAIGAAVPDVELYATDIDPVATRCAKRNIPGETFTGDLFDPLPEELHKRVDVIVVNPPYVPSAEIKLMPAEARDHEPLATLDGGADGLEVLRRVVREAPRWLAPGGLLLAETSERQADRAVAAITDAGLTPVTLTDDELEATVLLAHDAG